ncbi:hypothetical protein BDV36DRAFT_295703 [Aspergillus pseudocaelatus]|uniref:DUF6606 domain-containing protein n=1 Tax=Aspergillus pseudocaelatus TaxID=1825620 RepID=A0ABQ6WLL7_9EURO|nr:hypothetical protein BDV36DRAFT_295703 [Aspergillus pseudocaelatus]
MGVNSKVLPLSFNHVVLSPKLPGKQETEAQVIEVQNDLLSRVLDAAGKLKEISDAKGAVAWESIEKTLRTLEEVSKEGWVNEASLLGALKDLQLGNAIIVHVALQNACILIRHLFDEDDHIICNNNRELQRLYLSQGFDFCHRMQASIDYKKFLTDPDHRNAYTEQLKRLEQQTLEQLYQPQPHEQRDTMSLSTNITASFTSDTTSFVDQLRQSYVESQAMGSIKDSALEEVEQEREVAFEIEQEREIQRPVTMKAYRYPGLQKSIKHFVMIGRLRGNEGYVEAATVLESTDLGRKHGIDASTLLRSLYVSTEFTRTVETKEQAKSIDNFLRPVNWVLWNSRTNVGLVIIPEEAEDLIPIIRTMQSSTVHLILYAAPFTKRMLHFDTFNYYAFPSLPKGWSPPPWLPFELGILAGRLYFKFSDYKFLLEQLRVETEKPIAHVDLVAASSAAAASDNFFARSQLNFLQDWLTLRRQGQDISHTPMGYVCQGTRLRSDHPFFLDRNAVEEIEGVDRRLFYSPSCNASDEVEVYYDSDDDDAAATGVDMMEGGEDDVSDRDVNMQEED